MALETQNVLHAAAQVDTAVAGSFLANKGFSAIARTGAGDVTLTFDQQIADLERVPVITSKKAAPGLIAAWTTPDATSIRVTLVSDAAAAADGQFSIAVFKLVF